MDLETTQISQNLSEQSKGKIIFFNRKSLDHRKKKPKPIVYQIYLCCKCVPLESTESQLEKGAWCALIIKQLQDNSSTSYDTQTACMLSGVQESSSHIRIRLNGLKESLDWITSNIEENQYSSIEANIVMNDIFVVNILREWIPKWEKSSFNMGENDSEKRPNYDILNFIGKISTKINLGVKWQFDKSNEMITLSDKIDRMLADETDNIVKD